MKPESEDGVRLPFVTRSEDSERGFTLIEILVAIVIVGILASIAIPLFVNQYKRAETTELETSLLRAQVYLQEKKTENSGQFPRTFPYETLSFPDSATVKYSFSADRSDYCLQATDTRGTTRYVTSLSTGISQTSCTFPVTSTGATKPIISGNLANDGTYTLNWNESSADGTYKVYKDGALLKNVAGATQYKSTVKLDTVSTFYVMAGSQKSNTLTLSPARPKPKSAPVLSITDTNGDKVEWKGMLNWAQVANATSYLVYDNKGQELTGGGTSDTRFPVSTPIGTTRTFYVVAVNDLGKSPNSNVVTLQGPIPGGHVLKATPTYSEANIQLKLTWSLLDSKVNGAVKYNVYVDGSLKTTLTPKSYTLPLEWNTGVKKIQVKGVGANGVEGFESNIIEFSTATPALPKPVVAASGMEPAGAKYAPWVRVDTYKETQFPSWAFSHWKTKYAVNDGTQYTSLIGMDVPGGWEATYAINPGETLRVYVVAVDIMGRESPASDPVDFVTAAPTPRVTGSAAVTGQKVISGKTHYDVTFQGRVECAGGSTAEGTIYWRLAGVYSYTPVNFSSGTSNSAVRSISTTQPDRTILQYYFSGKCVTGVGGLASDPVSTAPATILAY